MHQKSTSFMNKNVFCILETNYNVHPVNVKKPITLLFTVPSGQLWILS